MKCYKLQCTLKSQEINRPKQPRCLEVMKGLINYEDETVCMFKIWY